jgi:hypothetical protein
MAASHEVKLPDICYFCEAERATTRHMDRPACQDCAEFAVALILGAFGGIEVTYEDEFKMPRQRHGGIN